MAFLTNLADSAQMKESLELTNEQSKKVEETVAKYESGLRKINSRTPKQIAAEEKTHFQLKSELAEIMEKDLRTCLKRYGSLTENFV